MSLPTAGAMVLLQFGCKVTTRPTRGPGAASRGRMDDPKARTVFQAQQPACSQPQPISITLDLSASSQYSLQYLLSFSGGQSHAPCAHLPESLLAIVATSLRSASGRGIYSVGGGLVVMLGAVARVVKCGDTRVLRVIRGREAQATFTSASLTANA